MRAWKKTHVSGGLVSTCELETHVSGGLVRSSALGPRGRAVSEGEVGEERSVGLADRSNQTRDLLGAVSNLGGLLLESIGVCY